MSHKMIDREGYNRELVRTLEALIISYPTMRFSQILAAFDFVVRDFEGHWKEEYYVEPDVVLKRVREAVDKILKGEQA